MDNQAVAPLREGDQRIGTVVPREVSVAALCQVKSHSFAAVCVHPVSNCRRVRQSDEKWRYRREFPTTPSSDRKRCAISRRGWINTGGATWSSRQFSVGLVSKLHMKHPQHFSVYCIRAAVSLLCCPLRAQPPGKWRYQKFPITPFPATRFFNDYLTVSVYRPRRPELR